MGTSKQAHGGSLACPSVRYLPSDGYYYTVSGGSNIILQRSRDLLNWERSAGSSAPFIKPSASDVQVASDIMSTAAQNLCNGYADLSIPYWNKWDRDSNDADLCCESWGG